jgi:hypothetical protein
MKKTDTITPFDWQRFTAATSANGAAKRTRAPRAPKKLTVRERVARILAQRWGNPYSKPGMA